MTEKCFYTDSYLKQLTARVLSIDQQWLELDRTIFYPLGGGQPGDTGVVQYGENFYKIEDTRKGDSPDVIRHQLSAGEHELSVGDEVTLHLDWDRRYKLMRMHSCMHLLGSLIPVSVTGGSVGAEKSRLDFDLGDHRLDKDDLTLRLNTLIEAATPVVFESISDAELDANPELVRTMSVQPPRGAGVIRMVRMQNVDYQPCGGTHVNNVAEIGPVRVSKIENKGKRNRRVHIVFADGVKG
jgi:misacylated tRNA(Ala) deacylase